MLINLTNHPSEGWEEEQLISARSLYNSIIDIPFPSIGPNDTPAQIRDLAENYVSKCIALLETHPGENNAVHIMGEANFCFLVVSLLIKNGVVCVASTSERNVVVSEGTKIVKFKFVQFRQYYAE